MPKIRDLGINVIPDGFLAMPKPCLAYSGCGAALACAGGSQCPVTACQPTGGGKPCSGKSHKPAKKKALNHEAVEQLQAQLQQKMAAGRANPTK